MFIIDNTKFEVEAVSDKFTVCGCEVVCEKFKNEFGDNDVVLVDEKVAELYNISHDKIIKIQAIEDNKNIDTVLSVCDTLIQYGFDKGHTLTVIGGGITQDIGAFTAKIFKRGINWIYVPTTILSQCDSCIGGKTALNFRGYKNQLGLFSNPNKVVIDVGFLNTQELNMFSNGEMVKMYMIGGRLGNPRNREEAILHSLMIKKAIVEYDQFELHERKALNYGHSFGHALESVLDYKISHSEAVMFGMEIVNRLFDSSIEEIISLDSIKGIDVDKLIAALKTDKKVKNGVITFVVAQEMGRIEFIDKNIDDMRDKINEILSN